MLIDSIQITIYLVVIVVLAVPLGRFMSKVLDGQAHFFLRPLSWLEYRIYRMCGIDPTEDMSWKAYAAALLLFNSLGLVILFLLQLWQHHLPLNPARIPAVPFLLALNTAISFVTNTNWQAYSGETTLSYFTQMLGLGTQNFLSAATGIAVMVAVARGLARKTTQGIGNFGVDIVRSTLYILLPISIVFAVLLLSQGVVQNFSPYVTSSTLEGTAQTLPMGPVASQIAIKELGTNGGGFFGINSAHPFENPTPLSNFFELLAILLFPAAMPIAFGRMVHHPSHGYAVFTAMLVLFLLSVTGGIWSESLNNPAIGNVPFYEGKEMRFGMGSSVLWAMATTAASNGSVNAMMSSLSPLAGGMAMLNIMLGEVIFGGIGAGMYGMMLFVILSIFIAGLMVGRTPEYLGKKIESREIKLASVGVLIPSVVILIFTAIASITHVGLMSRANQGPHGFSEILYAFCSAAGNNGSAFAGLNPDTIFYNLMTGLAMLIGRYGVIGAVLAIAGSLANKKQTPPSLGTFPTEGPLFIVLLCFTILIVGALTFFPALSVGPLVEHFLMLRHRTF